MLKLQIVHVFDTTLTVFLLEVVKKVLKVIPERHLEMIAWASVYYYCTKD